MTGLEKIISQILEDAQSEANFLLETADKEAAQILREGKQEAEKVSAQILQKGEAEASLYLQKIQSGSELTKRKELLKTRQEIIAGILKKSYEKLAALDTEEYFALMERILEVYVQPLSGEICFSRRDLERMPKEFEARAAAIAAAKGGALTLSKETRPISNGFILIYGMIEENCTISAMFDAKKEELQDQINRFLFS